MSENNGSTGNKKFLKGTLILTASSMVVKVIGSVNWIILSRILGGEGIGLYQMGFPIYLMAITVSSAGIPVAISIITAEKVAENDFFGAKRVFNVSLRLLFISGLVFSSALWFGAGWLIENHWIRDARAYYSIIALAPAVFFVTFLASFRGYLQGWQIMMPTAASEVVEQLMRVVTMIVFAYMFMPYGLEYAAGGASMGAGVGAFCAPCLAWYFGYPLPVFLFAAVAAAFVSQGTDLISDSLDTISRDSNYGVKTFAAVHGNRSKYDVNSDIKINGWSVIAGVGNADKFDNGSKFSWGVFYENGSGNYRTYNEFNNEFFRGDGSLVYNGGGLAARYTNKNGVYTEGSLRAGMLKSDMDNALRDGAGNFYGYESESAYYGAHIGIGKIISLSESSDLDVYGKFFHTYTEGDSFKVANDEFEFGSINSDRLRIGAMVTANRENKFSTYYGLAYEYEFNGDADMTAQGLKAPTQSLQGSSVMAEIGFNYQPTPTSPWSFDLNMRGYTGERQGGSFNVQATYTF